MPLKLFFIAGERSGDLHGGNLIKYIKSNSAEIQIEAWGGDKMQSAGAILKNHYQNMAFMGLGEVVKNIFTILGLFKQCKADILAFKPNAVVLIDYAGFNLRIAKFCRQNNIKVIYYISPKVWAWYTSRALKIKKLVNHLLVIFPFEVEFYKQFDYYVDYVGNPLMDEITAFTKNNTFKEKHNLSEKPIISLLAGSRKQEVLAMLPIMAQVSIKFPNYQFVIAGVDNLPTTIYTPYLQTDLKIIYDDTYNLLKYSEAALVTSGTATLETALLNIPQVVCYKTGWLTYAIGRRLIKVKFASLVNLIAEREVVKELIQEDYNAENLEKELSNILINKPNRIQQLLDYQEVIEKVGNEGASERAAKLILTYANV